MAVLSVSQATQYAAQAGFSGNAQNIIVAIAQAESGLNPQAQNCNNPGGTCDRGILQINSYWHSEVSDQCAYDPACAFQAAYRISGNGRNFSPWTTYTSGAYKQYLAQNNAAAGSTTNAAWWTFPRIDNYGQPDPFGGPKPDSNIQVPAGYPIQALLAGTVSCINSPGGAVPAWGAAITINLDTPVNSIATHTAYIHLASIAPGIQVGSHVNSGDLLGYNGSSQAAGMQKAPLGFALCNSDCYGYGPTWNQYLGNPQLDPTALLNSAKKNSGFWGNVPTTVTNMVNLLAPNANVAQVLYSLDQIGQIKNPFDVPASTDFTILGQDTGVQNPIDWLVGFGGNLFEDGRAFAFRLFLLLVGAFIMYKAFSRFVDLGVVVNAASNIGASAALLV